jgi:hypothetical protein
MEKKKKTIRLSMSEERDFGIQVTIDGRPVPYHLDQDPINCIGKILTAFGIKPEEFEIKRRL